MLSPHDECDIDSDAESTPNSIIFAGTSVTEKVTAAAVTENLTPGDTMDTPSSNISAGTTALADTTCTEYVANAAQKLAPDGVTQAESTDTVSENVAQVAPPVTTKGSDIAAFKEKLAQDASKVISNIDTSTDIENTLRIPTKKNRTKHVRSTKQTSNLTGSVGKDAVAVSVVNEDYVVPFATHVARLAKSAANVGHGPLQPESTINTSRRPEDSASSPQRKNKRRRSSFNLRSKKK